MRVRSLFALSLACPLALACKPEIPGRPSLIDGNRLLAVQSIPAESKPGDGTLVEYRALYAGPDGPADASGLEWAYCTAQKPLAVNAPMAPVCLARAGADLEQFHVRGPDVDATLPKDGCALFGPNPPPPKTGQPPGRAADPDTTGGYYQPVRVLIPGDSGPDYAVAETRLACDLGNATSDQTREYNGVHKPNTNPTLTAVELHHADGKSETLDSTATAHAKVKAGEAVTFRASWPACPVSAKCGDGVCSEGEKAAASCSVKNGDLCCDEDCKDVPKTCGGPESYTMLDPVVHALVKRRESMRVSWYATDGDWDHERTGRTEAEADTTFTENAWTAPATTGTSYLWVVLRDDRGGVGFETYEIDVEP